MDNDDACLYKPLRQYRKQTARLASNRGCPKGNSFLIRGSLNVLGLRTTMTLVCTNHYGSTENKPRAWQELNLQPSGS
jgi:hypothetical protein